MFEVGKVYKFKMINNGVIQEYAPARAIAVELPLVRFKALAIDGGGEYIINTSSAAFVGAQEPE